MILMDTDCIKLSPETPIGLLVMSNRSSSCLFLIKAFLAFVNLFVKLLLGLEVYIFIGHVTLIPRPKFES